MLQTVLLVLVGILVILTAYDNFKSSRYLKGNNLYEGKVISSNLKSEKREDTLLVHYYQLQVLYNKDNKQNTKGVKTTSEYKVDDKIMLCESDRGLAVFEYNGASSLSAFFLMLAGIAIIIVGITNQYAGSYAPLALALVLGFVALSLLIEYFAARKEKLDVYEGEVVDILLFDEDKSQRQFFKNNYYYPLIKYSKNNNEYKYLSHYGSRNLASFKIGKKGNVYFDEKNHCVVEKRSSVGTLIMALVFLALALLGFISIIMGG